jgi:hypothetical protein
LHYGAAYIHGTVLPSIGTAHIDGYAVNYIQSLELEVALSQDAKDSFFSCAVSIGDALRGISQDFSSWATVKLYYATFYAVQALLAQNGYCVFYINRKPKWVKAVAGERVIRGKGNSHQFVLNLFGQAFSGHLLLSQQIDLSDPLKWLMEKREDANYRGPGFPEPKVPDHLAEIRSVGIRRAVEAYLHDSSDLYTFDPDHAMVAFPIRALMAARAEIISGGSCQLAKTRVSFLKSSFRDRSGPLANLQKLFD